MIGLVGKPDNTSKQNMAFGDVTFPFLKYVGLAGKNYISKDCFKRIRLYSKRNHDIDMQLILTSETLRTTAWTEENVNTAFSPPWMVSPDVSNVDISNEPREYRRRQIYTTSQETLHTNNQTNHGRATPGPKHESEPSAEEQWRKVFELSKKL